MAAGPRLRRASHQERPLTSPPRPLRLLALGLALALLPGCWSGEKRPLFGGEEEPEPPQLGSKEEIPEPPRPPQAARTNQLLEQLRQADSVERARLVESLLARGEEVRPEVEGALAEERVLVDVLEELLGRLGPTPAKPQPGRVETPPWVQEKYRLALDRYLAGDIYASIQTVDAILALEPDTVLRQKLLRLRKACRQRLLRESVLTANLTVASGAIHPGTPLQARIRLKNLSEETVTLRLGPGQPLGAVNVDYEELSPDGARTRTRSQRAVRFPSGELVLRPGQVKAISLELPSPHRRLPPDLVGRYYLSGRLRAQTMLIGDAPYPVFVPLFPQEVVAVHRADWGLTVDPPASFSEAVVQASEGSLEERMEPARRAFVASVLMARDDREATLATLIAALEHASGPLSDAICAGLARANGEPLSFTRQEWLIWWKGRKSRPTKQDPEDRDDPR
jgi:hypothetical protein